MTSLLIYKFGFPGSIHLSFDIIYKYYSLLEDIYACTSVIQTPLQRLCLLLWHGGLSMLQFCSHRNWQGAELQQFTLPQTEDDCKLV